MLRRKKQLIRQKFKRKKRRVAIKKKGKMKERLLEKK